MLTSRQLKALLQAHHLRLSKRLGQNHLVEGYAVERIVTACRLTARDTVVEIGAGLGALTEPLAACAERVIAVEIDRGIAVLLVERMAPCPNVTVLHQDILEFDWMGVQGAVVVGAIPYSITSPILAALSQARQRLRRAILIMQREVAKRMLAPAGATAYGRLSVFVQYGWAGKELFTVPRRAFYPQPAVDSLCLELTPLDRPSVAVDDEARFFEIVKAAFSQRRKTLVNGLCSGERPIAAKPRVEALLSRLGLPPTVRGEALSLQQFAELANALTV